MKAIASENLKNLFTTEKWQDLFSTFSDAFGFTFSMYDESGTPIFVQEKKDLICKEFRSVPAFRALCEAACHPDVGGTISNRNPSVFKCHANILNFSLPIQYLDEKAVILGHGSFEQYEDFRECMNLMQSSDSAPLPIRMPVVFTTGEHTRKVRSMVADSVNRLLRNSQETVTLRKKFESLKTLLSGWGGSLEQDPEDLYRDMLRKLSTLLDIQDISVLTWDRKLDRRVGFRLSNLQGQHEFLNIIEQDKVLQDLQDGKPFVLSDDQGRQRRTDVPDDAADYFPIMVNNQLEAAVCVKDRVDIKDIPLIIAFAKQAGLSIENQRLHHDLMKKFNLYTALSELTKAITPIQDDKSLLQVILDKSAELLKAEQGSLMVLDHEADVLLLEAKKGITGVTDKLRIGRGEGIAGKVAERGEPFLVENLEKDPRIKQKNREHYKTPSFVSVPLKIENRIIGVLNLADKDGGAAFNEDDLKLMESIATQAAIVMERNAFYNKTEELKKLSITDYLTGLLNRRHLQQRLKDELSRSGRHSHELSLIMLDLDGFKECNDAYGHNAGDKTLKDVAAILSKTVRSIDIVARYGGDEFIVMLPETGLSITKEIAERLRRNVSNKTVEVSPSGSDRPLGSFTASIGIACYPDHGKTMEVLLENVDKALYRAKKKGKNSIEVFS